MPRLRQRDSVTPPVTKPLPCQDIPILVVVVSDLHCNSTVGLCPPGPFELDDGGSYSPSPAQLWLWDRWLGFWAWIRTIKETNPQIGRTIVVVNGDAADMNVHSGLQLITAEDLDAVVEITTKVLQPARECADFLFLTRGTTAHVGEAAHLEERVALALNAEPDGTRRTWDVLPLIAGGVRFVFQHHPATSSGRPWTRGNAAARLAIMALYEYAGRGEPPPAVCVYSHNHVFEDSGLTHRPRALITPAWQLATAHQHRRGYGDVLADIGGLAFVCASGEYQVHVKRFAPERRAPWAN
jgi:hypothetical protein